MPSTHKALKRAGLSIKDIGLFEINEAFAAQVLACNTDLKIDESRLNPNGGAVALGHPLGCSGARLVVTLTHEMRRRGAALGVDFALTVSCYQADADGRACGRCDSCRLRRAGFAAAGVADPTPYQT